MKYRYLIIDEDGLASGENKLTEFVKKCFSLGICEVIDCEQGERLTQINPEEWESIGLLEK